MYNTLYTLHKKGPPLMAKKPYKNSCLIIIYTVPYVTVLPRTSKTFNETLTDRILYYYYYYFYYK